MNIQQKYKKAKRYRIISMLIFITSLLLMVLPYGLIFVFIGILVGMYFASGYVCPFCDTQFDIRISSSKIKVCPNYGERLNYIENKN